MSDPEPQSRWEVTVVGPRDVLEWIASTPLGPRARVAPKGESGSYVLTSPDLEALDDPNEVRTAAMAIVRGMSTMAMLRHSTAKPLTVGGIVEHRPDGKRIICEAVSMTIRVGMRATAVVTRADGTVVPDPDVEEPVLFADAARVEPEFARALDALAKKGPDWRTLYFVFEIVEKLAESRACSDPVKLGWTTRANLKRFTHTAQDHRVIGPEARHGTQDTNPPANPMSDAEARDFVLRLLSGAAKCVAAPSS